MCFSELITIILIVGNAAFHSNGLYNGLKSSIGPLTLALEDIDDKTKANAAGAIGNLVRNGSELINEMASHSVPEKLMQMVMTCSDRTSQRIALFSLGTMSIYNPIRYGIIKIIVLKKFLAFY